jgi:hypothetical protein
MKVLAFPFRLFAAALGGFMYTIGKLVECLELIGGFIIMVICPLVGRLL